MIRCVPFLFLTQYMRRWGSHLLSFLLAMRGSFCVVASISYAFATVGVASFSGTFRVIAPILVSHLGKRSCARKYDPELFLELDNWKFHMLLSKWFRVWTFGAFGVDNQWCTFPEQVGGCQAYFIVTSATASLCACCVAAYATTVCEVLMGLTAFRKLRAKRGNRLEKSPTTRVHFEEPTSSELVV